MILLICGKKSLPLMKKAQEKGDIISIIVEKPMMPSREDFNCKSHLIIFVLIWRTHLRTNSMTGANQKL